ncbi:unnamed protein product [Prorocentrum cordatum]|uniref:FMN hydroxy acid dehydrogenase domain-containing protein n=1 Tax=Prorocentrum cordatum TaxID=2364126 RepID=A0ABN9T363_9DINO|nr:unnamed protein product [Polarella glacialis]
MATSSLGVPAASPFHSTATALTKLAHREGEVAIVRAAKKAGVPYTLPTLSSSPLDEMLAAREPGQEVFPQLCVSPERSWGAGARGEARAAGRARPLRRRGRARSPGGASRTCATSGPSRAPTCRGTTRTRARWTARRAPPGRSAA